MRSNKMMDHIKNLADLPPLKSTFFQGEVTAVARRLLGKVLITKGIDRKLTALVLSEVEAYSQFGDEASHCFRGKTDRNASMFEVGGTCYVYRSYGVHYCMNVVTGKKNIGSGVLLRAGVPMIGIEVMVKRRGLLGKSYSPQLISQGPGRLTQAMAINLSHNGQKFGSDNLKIVDAGFQVKKSAVISTSRVGISKAVDLPWRFIWKAPLVFCSLS